MPRGQYTRKTKPNSYYLQLIQACGIGKTKDNCWVWNGRLGGSNKSYGMVSFRGRDRGAHVVSLIVHGKDVPKGHVVMHTCDNPPCVNPRHLKVATQSENRRDCAMKGRAASGDKNGMRKYPEKSFFNTAESWDHAKGEQHGMAKLTDKQCYKIRNLYTGQRGELTKLGLMFGVSRVQIARIVKNKSRNHK